MAYTKSVGMQGEMDAEAYLKGLGARTVEQNFSCPVGEIDLIVILDGVLVFVEVKRRTNLRYGTPAEAVTPAKQKKIIRAAEWFLAQHAQYEMPMRFDVIEIMPGLFRHIPAAFDASGR